jgi:hypothetical protein
MHVLFIFMDGVGLGNSDPAINPFAGEEMPVLQSLLGGARLVAENASIETHRATLTALDACMGVDNLPQSATGQASLVTGKNIPKLLGYHYGPKPNPAVAELIHAGTMFHTLQERNQQAVLLNAYPPGYFAAIESGKRLYSAIPLAVTSAGIPLKTSDDYYAGNAMSADFTGKGWRKHLGMPDAPVYAPDQAGRRLASLAQSHDLAFFEFWLSDYIGHRQDMDEAKKMLRYFDTVLGAVIEAWDFSTGLLLITSDHGNLEDLSTRRHTRNAVPAVLIGSEEHRRNFRKGLHSLKDVAPAILNYLKSGETSNPLS